jgi:hypothetical protein
MLDAGNCCCKTLSNHMSTQQLCGCGPLAKRSYMPCDNVSSERHREQQDALNAGAISRARHHLHKK